jgi:uncharacterized protein YjbJ (UPF0337 family)
MAPQDISTFSNLPQIMAQQTQALSESFDKMTDGLLGRLQTQGKELTGQVTKDVDGIKGDVDKLAGEVTKAVGGIQDEVDSLKKAVEDVKQEATKAQPVPAPAPSIDFHVPTGRNSAFTGREEGLGKLLLWWQPGKKGRAAVVGLGGVGCVESSTSEAAQCNIW